MNDQERGAESRSRAATEWDQKEKAMIPTSGEPRTEAEGADRVIEALRARMRVLEGERDSYKSRWQELHASFSKSVTNAIDSGEISTPCRQR